MIVSKIRIKHTININIDINMNININIYIHIIYITYIYIYISVFLLLGKIIQFVPMSTSDRRLNRHKCRYYFDDFEFPSRLDAYRTKLQQWRAGTRTAENVWCFFNLHFLHATCHNSQVTMPICCTGAEVGQHIGTLLLVGVAAQGREGGPFWAKFFFGKGSIICCYPTRRWNMNTSISWL